MYKLANDMTKKSVELVEAENDILKSRNEQMTKQLEASKNLIETKVKEIDWLRDSGYRGAVVRDKKDDQNDADSEFSYATEEPGLKPEENILDLAIDNAEFYGDMLRQEIDLLDYTSKNFATFLTVEFYDHDTKVTDVSEGFTPNYGT